MNYAFPGLNWSHTVKRIENPLTYQLMSATSGHRIDQIEQRPSWRVWLRGKSERANERKKERVRASEKRREVRMSREREKEIKKKKNASLYY